MNTERYLSVTELDRLFEKVGQALEAARAKSHEGVDHQFDSLRRKVEVDYRTLKGIAERGELLAPPDLGELQGLAESATARHLQ